MIYFAKDNKLVNKFSTNAHQKKGHSFECPFCINIINLLAFIVEWAILLGGVQSATGVATRFALVVDVETLAIVAIYLSCAFCFHTAKIATCYFANSCGKATKKSQNLVEGKNHNNKRKCASSYKHAKCCGKIFVNNKLNVRKQLVNLCS